MGTWDSIDGGCSDNWEYVPFEIMQDTRTALTSLNEAWPIPCAHVSTPTLLRRAFSNREDIIQNVLDDIRGALHKGRGFENAIDEVLSGVRGVLEKNLREAV